MSEVLRGLPLRLPEQRRCAPSASSGQALCTPAGAVARSTTVRATRGSRRRLRGFWRPSAVLIRTCVPSWSTQTGVIWGEPSGISVTKWARLGSSMGWRAASGSSANVSSGLGLGRDDAEGLDLVDDALRRRRALRVGVAGLLAHLAEAVDRVLAADDLDDAAADLQRREGLVDGGDGDGDARVALEVARLLPVGTGADHDVVAVTVDPDGRDLGRAVWA